MSTNRENVTWQRPDGSWAIGFYNFYYVNEDSDDFDYEWDVEYEYDRFNFVSSERHTTPESAYEEYNRSHSNPGGTNIVSYTEENKRDIALFEEMRDTLLKSMPTVYALARGPYRTW